METRQFGMENGFTKALLPLARTRPVANPPRIRGRRVCSNDTETEKNERKTQKIERRAGGVFASRWAGAILSVVEQLELFWRVCHGAIGGGQRTDSDGMGLIRMVWVGGRIRIRWRTEDGFGWPLPLPTLLCATRSISSTTRVQKSWRSFPALRCRVYGLGGSCRASMPVRSSFVSRAAMPEGDAATSRCENSRQSRPRSGDQPVRPELGAFFTGGNGGGFPLGTDSDLELSAFAGRE